MYRTSSLLRVGLPMLILVLLLVIAIVRTGVDDTGDNNENDLPPGDEQQVGEVNVDSVSVEVAESFPVQVFVHVSGYLPDPCWEAHEPVVEQDGNHSDIEIAAERDAEAVCPQVIEEYETRIELGETDPGEYVVVVNGVEQEFEVH